MNAPDALPGGGETVIESMKAPKPQLSVIVVVYNMPKHARRTLQSLHPGYQRGMSQGDYEVIVVDNRSSPPVDRGTIESFGSNFRLVSIANAPRSPARAINHGVARARGDMLAIMIDGARLASPGILRQALLARALHPRPIIATLSWHLGPGMQGDTKDGGYDEATEDGLLESVRWPEDGYRLFAISALAGSYLGGWFSPLVESCCLLLGREPFAELGGYDERFDYPGGGLVNPDFFARACSLPDVQPIVLLGEGTFHQMHEGATSVRPRSERAEEFRRWNEQYARLRGKRYSPPPIDAW